MKKDRLYLLLLVGLSFPVFFLYDELNEKHVSLIFIILPILLLIFGLSYFFRQENINKYKLVLYFTISLVFAWMYSIHILAEEHASLLLWVSVLIPIFFVAVVFFLRRDLIPQEKLIEIEKLAIKIEQMVEKSDELINEKNAPHEIKPLINSVNRLISYQEDRYKNERDFTANASHELRTPLAGIRLQTEFAMQTDDPVKKNRALNNVLYSVDRATRLVEQLLALSRLTAEKIDLAKEQIDLSRIVQRTISELRHLAFAKNILIETGRMENCVIEANEQSLEILINNLLRNSIIYTQDGGKIKIETYNQNGKIFSISDNGPGIPESKRKAVFKRFEKAEQSAKTGTGLGLSIAKRIADLHDAEIVFDDNEDMKGIKVLVKFNA